MSDGKNRTRHNGDQVEAHAAGAALPAETPAQDARKRLARAAEAAGSDARPRGLPDTFVDERNDVLAVINELEDQLDRHQEIREAMERELMAAAEKLQAASQRVQELEWQSVTLQTRVDTLEQLRNDVTALEEELADANARAQRANEQFIEADKERARLKTELKAAGRQIEELWPVRKERDALRADHKALSLKVEELERARREIHEQRTALQTQNQQIQTALEETANERNRLQVAARAAEDRIKELTLVSESLNEKIEALREEKKNLQAQITHLERENSRLVEQRQFYECEVAALRNQNRTAEATLNSVKKAFSEVRLALSETRARARRRALDTWPRIETSPTGVIREASSEGTAGVPAVNIPDPVTSTTHSDAEPMPV